MRTYLLVGICLALACSADGQQRSNLEEAVRISLFEGVSEGQRVKEIQRAGDAAAVVITKIVAGKSLTESEKEIAVDLLQEAFSRLSWVTVSSDREPRTALFVLDALSCSSRNPALIKRAQQTKRAILESAKSFQTSGK